MRAAARETVKKTVSGSDPNAKPVVQPVDVSRALTSVPASNPQWHPTESTNQNARQALDRALLWIVRQQQPDGRWKMTGPTAREPRAAKPIPTAERLLWRCWLCSVMWNTPRKGPQERRRTRD